MGRYRDALRLHQGDINRLNVYPVPDGDTGTNMALTLEAVVTELEEVPAGSGLAAVCRAIGHGSLMGARGNSGVILSQLLRGMCERIERGRRSEAVDAAVLADALGHASRAGPARRGEAGGGDDPDRGGRRGRGRGHRCPPGRGDAGRRGRAGPPVAADALARTPEHAAGAGAGRCGRRRRHRVPPPARCVLVRRRRRPPAARALGGARGGSVAREGGSAGERPRPQER